MYRGDRELIKVFKDTRFQSVTIYKYETRRMVENTLVVLDPSDELIDITEAKDNAVFVTGGSAETAYAFAKDGRKVAVLNFADAIIPGGCVEYGAPTQEENLCRCTNVYESLVVSNDYYYINSLAPDMIYTDTLIYSPQCVMFKDDVDYTEITPVKFDIITCPSPAKLVEEEVYLKRIEGIIKTAVLQKVDTIILGAWGCGAFGQDAFMMGRRFAQVLNKYNHFNEVVFAIRPSSKGWAESNKKWFERGFKSAYNGIKEEDKWPRVKGNNSSKK